MNCLDVVKEDMREDEVFGCGEGGLAGGRSEVEDEVFGCGEGGLAGGRR